MDNSQNSNFTNKSKQLGQADDSAARLLIELLGSSVGRNFDIESIFVEKTKDGVWRWFIFEFLKAETIPPQLSHPNFYWYKNGRKFLSLWAVVQTFRKAGYKAELILVNYADDRSLGIKRMLVTDVKVETNEVYCTKRDGTIIYNHVQTIDSNKSFEDFKQLFKTFNDTKQGDTWEILDDLMLNSANNND
ncbi:hypothetical protein B0681_09550 [Moraxella porci DSM 25326]|uniref:Uncharacterized protein n=1 Tax=Moraxella porci DSM 25326 TaxID=573983 RepID=A0A1T0CM39_9GAMM|nr:hypothetical protein [Moraxella porci]OOS23432.1 hypothetical protein B0681_09550 [Moraxella porci DSM 25326]